MFSMLSAAQLLNWTKCQCLQVFLWVCVCARAQAEELGSAEMEEKCTFLLCGSYGNWFKKQKQQNREKWKN